MLVTVSVKMTVTVLRLLTVLPAGGETLWREGGWVSAAGSKAGARQANVSRTLAIVIFIWVTGRNIA